MATVCKWLGFYLCLKEPELPVINPIDFQKNSDPEKCDVVVTWKAESPKEKSGGLAFEVILQPAVTPILPPIIRDKSPTKDLSLNAEEIEKKLKQAEERRLSVEAGKLLLVNKCKDRAAEVVQRAAEINEIFSRDTEKKLSEKMEVNADNKNMRIMALQDRLREHAARVEEVRKIGEKNREELKERIDRKLEVAEGNRDARLKRIQEHIQKHEKHIEEVMEQSSKFSRDTEEKLIQKMESSVKNREKQLSLLLDRLRDHERHVEKVRLNKLNMSMTDDGGSAVDARRLSDSSDNNDDDDDFMDEGFENEDQMNESTKDQDSSLPVQNGRHRNNETADQTVGQKESEGKAPKSRVDELNGNGEKMDQEVKSGVGDSENVSSTVDLISSKASHVVSATGTAAGGDAAAAAAAESC